VSTYSFAARLPMPLMLFRVMSFSPMATDILPAVNGARIARESGGRETDLWYFGLRCACGKWIAVAEDWVNLFCSEARELELQYPITVECECGTLISTQRLTRFKTPR
jgi:hypothetical protein